MKWFVATSGLPVRSAATARPRPTTKWACTCTTSGFTSRSTSAVAGEASHGRHTWKVGCVGYRCERSRCTVTPSRSTRPGRAVR